jgi:hypothetical protein
MALGGWLGGFLFDLSGAHTWLVISTKARTSHWQRFAAVKLPR